MIKQSETGGKEKMKAIGWIKWFLMVSGIHMDVRKFLEADTPWITASFREKVWEGWQRGWMVILSVAHQKTGRNYCNCKREDSDNNNVYFASRHMTDIWMKKKTWGPLNPWEKGIHTDFTHYSCSKAQTLSSSKSFMQRPCLASPCLWPVFSFHSFDFKARTAEASRIHKLLMLQLSFCTIAPTCTGPVITNALHKIVHRVLPTTSVATIVAEG